MTRYIYTIPLPGRSADQQDSRLQQQLAASGLLGKRDGQSVQQVSLDQNEFSENGHWRYGGPFDEKCASELESLGESSFGAVALHDNEETPPWEAYYEVRDASVNPVHQSFQEVWQFDITVSKVGTHETHWRAVDLDETDVSTDNPFASTGSVELIGLDDDIDQPRWYSGADGSERASVDATVSSEFTDIQHYDPDAASFDPEFLIYELDFGQSGVADVTVWDPRDGDKFKTVDGTDVTRWIHVFNSDYEFTVSGHKLLDNGLIRLEFDESAQTLSAEEWNDTTEAWDTISIDHTNYELYDISLTSVGSAQTIAYVEFASTSDNSIEALECHLNRGADLPIWLLPENETSIPTDLETMLTPVASDVETFYAPESALVSRSEVEQ